MKNRPLLLASILASIGGTLILLNAEEPVAAAKNFPPAQEISTNAALIDGTGPGWIALTKDDFENWNGAPDTWTFDADGTFHCTGQPEGVLKSKKRYENLEISVQWMHKKSGGNSGVFLWATEQSLAALKGVSGLPVGIEVQVLDHGYAEQYEKSTGKKTDWFTSNGDVFPTGDADMKPFQPVAPDGKRSFPTENRSNGINKWNHYYIRAINGEVRLWVNGKEVSGGTGCTPTSGYLCLESEGSPIDFKNLRIRELPPAPAK